MRALAVVFLLGCAPDLGQPPSLVTGPRVLAVRSDPPEAKPGEEVTLELAAGGELDPAVAAWAFCTAPKPVTENNVVSPACLDGASVVTIGDGARVTAKIPADACKLFGPETPPGEFRPREPDTSGGFYQPVRVTADSEVAFGLPRIRCNLANAPQAAVEEMRENYVPNLNPELRGFTPFVDRTPVALDAVPAGASITVSAGWTTASEETYLVYDVTTGRVVSRPESLRASWFVTGGAFELDHTAPVEDYHHTENRWTAPPTPGVVTMWVVLRDDRGGVSVARHELEVRR